MGTILIAIIIVGMQVLHSRANDRRLLAKWQRLPVFVYGSPKVYRRKAALTWYVWLSGFMAAVLVALGVGIFFGFYPAWRASRLDPIEALRRE